MQVTIHEAKTRLSKLIEAALAGEGVVIARGGRPVVKIVRSGLRIGVLAGEPTGAGPDFLEPMEELELARWEGAR